MTEFNYSDWSLDDLLAKQRKLTAELGSWSSARARHRRLPAP